MEREQQSSEQFSEMLDPHRREERQAAATELAGRIFQKGINVSAEEDPGLLADLLSSIERFENAVINRGGDLMVNMPDSTDPQDPAFVLPQRRDDESLSAYIGHIDAATAMLEEPRRISSDG